MKTQYLFRLDDICPTVNWDNFYLLKKVFDKYQIKPILGVIPDNKDSKLAVSEPRDNFWETIKDLGKNNWIIAQHGYQHTYVNENKGILGINDKSEFAGLSYEEQMNKAKSGKMILEEKLDMKIRWWMAPAHSFDENTCRVLKDLGFEYITDGIALYPFEKYGLKWIPQQMWRPKSKMFGTWTICIHPNSIDAGFMDQLEKFIARNKNNCLDHDLSCKQSILSSLYHHWWKLKYLIYKKIIKRW